MTPAKRTSLFRAACARTDGPALGTWVKLPTLESMELVALAGFDFAVIDLEHSPIDLETAFALIGAALRSGVSPIVRVPGLDSSMIGRLLDAGAEGIMFPHIDTVQDAAKAVALARFPPLGGRGCGVTSRAGGWGAVPLEEYLRYGQDEVVLIAQLESAEATRNAFAIGSTEGIDMLLVGAADLSLSEQKPDSDPAVRALIRESVVQAHAAGLPIGNAGGATEAAVQDSVDQGFTFTVMGNDASLLGAALRTAVAAGRAVRLP